MALIDTLCDTCKVHHISSKAVIWCGECEDYLCHECHEDHNQTKYSHVTISVDEYKTLPAYILEIKYNCEEHKEKKKYYCLYHESVLCLKCKETTHKVCKDVMLLDDVVQFAKSSTVFDSIQKILENVAENLILIQKDREENIRTIEIQRENIQKEILCTRKSINQQLDDLENEILSNLSILARKERDEITMVVMEINKKKEVINVFHDDIDVIQKYASNFQTFLGTKTMEKQIFEVEEYIYSLFETGKLKQTSIDYKCDNKLTKLKTTLRLFGDLHKTTKPPSDNLSKLDPTKAILNGQEHSLMNASNFRIAQKIIPQEDSHITACCVLAGGDIVLANNDLLQVYNNDLCLEHTISLGKTKPYCIGIIDDVTVAVSTGSHRQIHLVDLLKNQITRSIPTTEPCCGITKNNENSIIYCLEGKGLYTTDLNKFKSKEVFKDHLSWLSDVTVFRDQVCYTCGLSGVVTLLNSDYKILWTLHDPLVLSYPCGITVDRNGTFYVTGYYSNNVAIVSKDGRQYRQIVGKEDGLNRPFSIFFEKTNERLYIANYKGPLFQSETLS